MNIVNEISTIQSELESLRAENKILREAKVLADFEISQLGREIALLRERNALLQSRCDTHLSGKVRLKTILDQAGQSLVNGINAYNAEERNSEAPELIGTEAPRQLESNAA